MGGEILELLKDSQEDEKILSLEEIQNYLQEKVQKVQVEILDKNAFFTKLAERKISDKLTRAFTYRDEITQQIHIIFLEGYKSNKIVQHELRRVNQVIQGNNSALQAYFEGIEEKISKKLSQNPILKLTWEVMQISMKI